MTGKLTTLAMCLSCMVIFSGHANAADPEMLNVATETKTAFFQPRPGGVLDVISSPFRALTAPASYNRGYQPRYGQSVYGRTNCVNGKCNTTNRYQSPCASGNCGVGSSCNANCSSGNCFGGNCPGGNCGVNQNYTGYRGTYGYGAQQYPAYRPVSQPVYRSYRPVSQPVYQPYRSTPTNTSRNDPFFP